MHASTVDALPEPDRQYGKAAIHVRGVASFRAADTADRRPIGRLLTRRHSAAVAA